MWSWWMKIRRWVAGADFALVSQLRLRWVDASDTDWRGGKIVFWERSWIRSGELARISWPDDNCVLTFRWDTSESRAFIRIEVFATDSRELVFQGRASSAGTLRFNLGVAVSSVLCRRILTHSPTKIESHSQA